MWANYILSSLVLRSLDLKNLYLNSYSYKSETSNSIFSNVVNFFDKSTKTIGKKIILISQLRYG